jgi:hypothetical protein
VEPAIWTIEWLAWNIPAKAGGIPEGTLPEGSVIGTAGVGRGGMKDIIVGKAAYVGRFRQ